MVNAVTALGEIGDPFDELDEYAETCCRADEHGWFYSDDDSVDRGEDSTRSEE